MIAPTRRLIFLASLTLLPLSLWGSLMPWAFVYALALSLAVVLAVLADAALASRRARGASVELPFVVRMTRGRQGEIPALVTGESWGGRLRLGLLLPPEVDPGKDDDTVLVPEGSSCPVSFPCMPRVRGRFPVAGIRVGTPSPLGLWEFRETRPCGLEIRVYPDLSRDRKRLSALFLNRGGYGIHRQRQVGKGREFEKLREYVPGDSYDEIHWKATAKRRKPITKVFQIERTQEVYVAVDASRLSARVPREAPQGGGAVEADARGSILEDFITSSLVIALAAQKQGDLFGLVTFSDRIHDFIRAGSGMAHHGLCRDILSTLEPALVNPDFDELCSFIRLKLRRRALVILLTSLEDPVLAENLVRNLEMVSTQHVVLVNMIRPDMARPLFASDSVDSVDDIHAALAGHMVWHHLRELERVLNRSRAHLCLLERDRMGVDLVSQYLDIKQRQVL
jgi:uncharacterized protein (DUF58 family)